MAGNGGSVSLASDSGSVSVSSRVQVSSNDQGSGGRRSVKGGSIAIRSGKSTGVAVNISNSSQLLALLDAAAPGPGGKITILATGANSIANVNGNLVADRGTIDLRHTGDNGSRSILAAPTPPTPLTLTPT